MTISDNQYDDALLNDIQELIELYARRGRVYIDTKTERYREFASNKIVPKSAIRADSAKSDKLLLRVFNGLKFGNIFGVAFADYFPELALGRMNNSASWFYEIGSGQRPYARRSASDLTVIEHGNDLVDAMLSVHRISCGIETGEITQQYPLKWYESNASLYALSKTLPVLDESVRTSIHNAMLLLLKAREDGRPEPSRLEVWLAMNPRELFTTDEGRAERDRQEARFKNGEVNFDGESNDHFKQSASI